MTTEWVSSSAVDLVPFGTERAARAVPAVLRLCGLSVQDPPLLSFLHLSTVSLLKLLLLGTESGCTSQGIQSLFPVLAEGGVATPAGPPRDYSGRRACASQYGGADGTGRCALVLRSRSGACAESDVLVVCA